MSDTEALAMLRKAFPADTVGKLPRVTCKACSNDPRKHCEKHDRRDCAVCGNWITTAHMHLDYVGHAEVTDRLLSVDPAWSWEPVAWTDAGAPLIAKGASGEWVMWIRLTVCGVTRLGVGSVSSGFDAEKQLIGDALRNAAMRFGVALDLWSKSELESAADDTPIAGPAPAPDPGRQRRSDLAARAKALPVHEYEAFKAWLATSGFPGVPKELDDAQCAAAEEWVTNAESAAEHDAETASEAPQGHDTASEPPRLPDAAPGLVRASEDDPDARRAAAASEYAKSLSQVELLLEFGKRNVTAPRRVGEQRQALADLLYEDKDWSP